MNAPTITNEGVVSINGRRWVPALILLALLAVALAMARPAGADPYLVTVTADSGPGSLRQAIDDANSHPGPDTITFDPATDGIPIVLAGAAGEDGNASGDLDILDGGDLTVQGNGAGNTIIDGGGLDRVFHICPGGGCTGTIVLSGLTIQNGYVAFSGGGGIRHAGGTAIVDGSALLRNRAVNGGGITNLATLIVQNDTAIGEAGGGNQATSGSGGGIYNYAGTLTIDHSTVSTNTALNNGGGVWNQATLTVQNGSTIGGVGVGNQADLGGGIYNFPGGVVTVDDSTVSDNSAGDIEANTGDGGGIYNTDGGEVTVDGSAVSGNTAGHRGGGIYSEGAATVNASTVSDNDAYTGGGIRNLATLNVLNGSTIGGAGAGNEAVSGGGGIYNTGVTTVGASVVSDNYAASGGGIRNFGTLYVQNGSTIGGAGAGNEAGSTGGGIYNEDGTTRVDNSTVSDNTANDDGGGIHNQGILIVRNGSTIGGAGAGNEALGGMGGGIFNGDSGTTTVDASAVSGNTADNYGGGIWNEGTLTIKNGSTIGGAGAGNQGVEGGGGVFNHAGSTTVDASAVSGNISQHGGGIYSSATLGILNGSTIGGTGAGNEAVFNGGGIVNYDGTTTVDASTISGNTADTGGGIYNDYRGATTVTGSRILLNIATDTGGGLFNDEDAAGATQVTGSCIVGNSAMSVRNNQPAEQIATGNWWGVATGPNTPGADTVHGNVDVSGFLTAPILDCASELQVSKANDTGGVGAVGAPFHWTLSVSNTGLISATWSWGETILVDELPGGPTYGAPDVGNLVNVVGGAHIDCSLADDTLTCQALGGEVTLGPVTGRFEVSFSVTPSAPVTLVNPAGLCRVDPGENVTETDEGNNSCPADVVDVELATVYLPLVLPAPSPTEGRSLEGLVLPAPSPTEGRSPEGLVLR